ncbi:hypothetical protein A2U01_0000544, partial [Trifolium medium]|nr:hypothetical protein [Trifolium medium]
MRIPGESFVHFMATRILRNNLGKDSAADIDKNGFLTCKTDKVLALPDEFLSKGYLSCVTFAYWKSGNTNATTN